MGIRYYAFALAADKVEAAQVDPAAFIHPAEHESIDRSWADGCLDKGWYSLQGLLGDPSGTFATPTRPAYQLVAGDVTYPQGYEHGYLPHYGVLTARVTKEVSRDIQRVTAADVHRYLNRFHRADRGDEEDVLHYLRIAQTFVQDVASRGQGVIYAIT